MSDSWHGGKGSKRRPTDRQRYGDNYDRIFKSKTQKFPETDLDTEQDDDNTGQAGQPETSNG